MCTKTPDDSLANSFSHQARLPTDVAPWLPAAPLAANDRDAAVIEPDVLTRHGQASDGRYALTSDTTFG
jgi:hypothetical protein